MRKDELNRPLKRRGVAERLWAKRPTLLQVTSMCLGLAFAAGVGWIVKTPYPFGGEPVLVLAIPPAEIMTASTDEAPPPPEQAEAAPAEPIPDTGADPKIAADPIIVEPEEEQRVADTGTRIIVSNKRSLAAAPIESVAEEGPYGTLPRVGRGNKKPADVYARPTSRGVALSDQPKIVIVLGGMGLNEALTKRAIKDLPGEITLGFAPYGDNLQPQVNRARASGHEVLLQVPMEPFGYPATNPGPKTLISANDANANLDALMWHMGRFAGYTGLMNYMGGKFLSEPAALKPVFSELRKRGLVYVGDGTVVRSLTVEMGKMTGLPVRDAVLVIDANPTPESIARRLKEIEDIARRDGIAIGAGSGLELTIDAVEEWAKSLSERGFVLMPASAAFKGRQG